VHPNRCWQHGVPGPGGSADSVQAAGDNHNPGVNWLKFLDSQAEIRKMTPQAMLFTLHAPQTQRHSRKRHRTEHLFTLEEVVRRQPPPRRITNARSLLRAAHARERRVLAVLDDDPTGTQTVQNVPVYLGWNDQLIEEAMAAASGCFYLSTNSRSLSPEVAANQAREIGRMLVHAGAKTARPVTVASRSDSTLRGHFPGEVDSLIEGLGYRPAAILLVPAFFDGGRFTLGDTHWVQLGERLVPAAETENACDPQFGYRASNLREWIEEKTRGRVQAREVRSLSLELIRNNGVDAVASELKEAPVGSYFIVNALEDADLEVVSLALLDAEGAGKRFLLRTAASMVKVYAGIEDRPFLRTQEIATAGPGLVVVGSYVQRTTEQVASLVQSPGVAGFEVSINDLTSRGREQAIRKLAGRIDASLLQGRTTVVFTSRERECLSGAEFVEFGKRIMLGLTSIVKRLKVRPAFVVAKGGITSHCVAVQGLSANRARVLGQIIAGVPVWELGAGAKWEGIPYVVFPGNVGDPGALAGVVELLTNSKTKNIS
jgi:uncharacterized protein YgbK (DUF1537 family)